jgi:hypothetical protein
MATEQNRVTRDGQAQGPTKNRPRTEEVAVAAYHIAERRGFAGDQQLDDWLSAERELGSQPSVSGDDEIAARGLVQEDIAADQIDQWAEALDVTPERLRVSIQSVGPSFKAVRTFPQSARGK